MFTKYISIKIFTASFFMGLVFIYILGPGIKKVFVYPTPFNTGKVILQDNTHNCFVYQQKEVKCPSNESNITQIPVQI